MKVFLTGATGYVGAVVAEQLQAAGHTVLGLARNQAAEMKLRARGITPHHGDVNAPQTLAEGARRAEGVIHTAFIHDFDNFHQMISVDRLATHAMLDALEGTGKPFIATNGSAFLGDTGDVLADESAPINRASFAAPRALTDADIMNAANRNIRSVVLRLPFYVYGRGGSVFIPARLNAARQAGVSLYVDEGRERASSVHVEDAARLYVLGLERARAGSLYHVADGPGATSREIAEAIARNVGCPTASVTWERAQQAWGMGLTLFFTMNNQISPAKVEQELDWKPQIKTTILEDIATGSYFA